MGCHGEATWERVREFYLEGLPWNLPGLMGSRCPGSTSVGELSGRDDVVLGLLTGNLVEGARRKLGHFGLDGHFDRDGQLFGGFGDHDRDRDDVARRGREHVRQELDWWEPNEVWVIGDTPLDVQCARAIGVRVLAVATGMFSRDEIAVGSRISCWGTSGTPTGWCRS
ncbi:MAG: hypothetical protein CM1200mP2_53110 [Planctomycetaceae bacterium]|nr:MAG: hypothetical protein CM1200mP2_53110 [Planctomycetaceae bacterium]